MWLWRVAGFACDQALLVVVTASMGLAWGMSDRNAANELTTVVAADCVCGAGAAAGATIVWQYMVPQLGACCG